MQIKIGSFGVFIHPSKPGRTYRSQANPGLDTYNAHYTQIARLPVSLGRFSIIYTNLLPRSFLCAWPSRASLVELEWSRSRSLRIRLTFQRPKSLKVFWHNEVSRSSELAHRSSLTYILMRVPHTHSTNLCVSFKCHLWSRRPHNLPVYPALLLLYYCKGFVAFCLTISKRKYSLPVLSNIFMTCLFSSSTQLPQFMFILVNIRQHCCGSYA